MIPISCKDHPPNKAGRSGPVANFFCLKTASVLLQIELPTYVSGFLLYLLTLLPALVKALVIFIVGRFLARLFARLVETALRALGIDKLAAKLKQIDLIASSNVEVVISAVVGKIVYYIVMLIVLMAAIEALQLQMVSELVADLIDYIPKALSAFAVLVLGLFVADLIKKLVLTTCRSLGLSSANLVANVVFFFIFINIILIALNQADLQTEFMEQNIGIILAGVVAAFAIGYGFASRDIMSNLLAAFYNRDRLRIGDEITISGRRGEVIQLNNNNIVLRTTESEVVVPFKVLSEIGVEIHSRAGSANVLPPHEGS